MTPFWDGQAFAHQFSAVTGVERMPVAITFLDAPPSNVPKFEGTEPFGCSFWSLAAEGRIFYTVPQNHFICAVSAYTVFVRRTHGYSRRCG